MNADFLRDLQLAGVKWEITELPMALYVGAKKEAKLKEQKSQEEKKDIPTLKRVATSVVPPIEPLVPMSLDIAKAMALRPLDLDALRRMISEFNHPLKVGATNVVLPSFSPNSNGVLIVTDIPSSEDDECGNVLSGPAGDLLDKMLAAIHMSRENVAILPLVFWRTPGGRSPSRNELDLARPFVDRAISLLKPRIIITLGVLAANEIAGLSLPKDHGVQKKLDCGATAFPIFHPNYLILKPAAKRDVWIVLQEIEKMLKIGDK